MISSPRNMEQLTFYITKLGQKSTIIHKYKQNKPAAIYNFTGENPQQKKHYCEKQAYHFAVHRLGFDNGGGKPK
jgi:hypothetical protein